MIKLFGKSIDHALKLNFDTSKQEERFPDCWKKVNEEPVHKNKNKNLLRNYRPISLLSMNI